MRAFYILLLSVAALVAASCTTMSEYSITPHQYSGVRLYQVFCSSCHGLTGRGDGPIEPLLRGGAPDLTELTHRYGGRFPEEMVRQAIDGRAARTAHGSREMPVWGFEFYGNVTSDRVARKQADETIQRLVAYLRSIQTGYED